MRLSSAIAAVAAFLIAGMAESPTFAAQRHVSPTGVATEATLTDVADALDAQGIAKGTPGNPSVDTLSVQDNNAVTGPVSNSATPATAVGTILTQPLATNGVAFSTVTVIIPTIGTGASVQVQCSLDGSTGWTAIRMQSAAGASATTSMQTVGMWYGPALCPYARLYQSAITSGSTTAGWFFTKGTAPITDVATAARATAGSTAGGPTTTGCAPRTSNTYRSAGQISDDACTTAGAKVNLPFSIPELTWSYATPQAGITNTTDAQMVGAAGAGVRNYTTGCTFANASATATVTEVRDGSGGTALGRVYLGANAANTNVRFDPPLRGSANTAAYVANVTTAAAVIGTCTGFQAQ